MSPLLPDDPPLQESSLVRRIAGFHLGSSIPEFGLHPAAPLAWPALAIGGHGGPGARGPHLLADRRGDHRRPRFFRLPAFHGGLPGADGGLLSGVGARVFRGRALRAGQGTGGALSHGRPVGTDHVLAGQGIVARPHPGLPGPAAAPAGAGPSGRPAGHPAERAHTAFSLELRRFLIHTCSGPVDPAGILRRHARHPAQHHGPRSGWARWAAKPAGSSGDVRPCRRCRSVCWSAAWCFLRF